MYQEAKVSANGEIESRPHSRFPESYLLHHFSNKKPHSTHFWEDHLQLSHLIFTTDLRWVAWSHSAVQGTGGLQWNRNQLTQGTQLGRGPLNFPPHPPIPAVLLWAILVHRFKAVQESRRGNIQKAWLKRISPVKGKHLWSQVASGTEESPFFPSDGLRPKLNVWGKQHFHFQDLNEVGCVLTTTAMHTH